MPKLTDSTRNHYRGFTLIELLVSITLISLLVTFGISAYTNSQERQRVKAAADELEITLEQIHQQAIVGKRPDECIGSLRGITVQTTQDTGILTATTTCNNPTTPVEYTINDLTFTSSYTFTYLPLTSGVSIPGATTLNIDFLDYSGNTRRFSLSNTGILQYLGAI